MRIKQRSHHRRIFLWNRSAVFFCLNVQEVRMISIKNSDAKKVCRVDPQSRTVEIVHKGCCTTIRFLKNGTYKVINTKNA